LRRVISRARAVRTSPSPLRPSLRWPRRLEPVEPHRRYSTSGRDAAAEVQARRSPPNATPAMKADRSRWPVAPLAGSPRAKRRQCRDRGPHAAGHDRIQQEMRDADVPLSAQGLVQARALGTSFANRPARERPEVVLAVAAPLRPPRPYARRAACLRPPLGPGRGRPAGRPNPQSGLGFQGRGSPRSRAGAEIGSGDRIG
jgi:hypothetical protein